MRKLLLPLLLLSVLLGVVYNHYKTLNIPYSFYHWTQNYAVATTTTTPPKYVKVFDVHFTQQLQIQITKLSVAPKRTIIPVVYLDNSVFLHQEANPLAQKIFKLLEQKARQNFDYSEVQFDCDWSSKTRSNYFEFLIKFAEISQKKLSATLRLHQIKFYQKTGVPPVDYGVLMYYNMSDFKDANTKNYILDLQVAKQYHHNFKSYPLQLNLALPLYAQATILRFEQVVGAMEGIRQKDLDAYFKPLEKNRYLLTKTHYFKGRLLYKGDILRLDAVTVNDLKKAVQELKEVMLAPQEIIFFRWENRDFYGEEALHQICRW